MKDGVWYVGFCLREPSKEDGKPGEILALAKRGASDTEILPLSSINDPQGIVEWPRSSHPYDPKVGRVVQFQATNRRQKDALGKRVWWVPTDNSPRLPIVEHNARLVVPPEWFFNPKHPKTLAQEGLLDRWPNTQSVYYIKLDNSLFVRGPKNIIDGKLERCGAVKTLSLAELCNEKKIFEVFPPRPDDWPGQLRLTMHVPKTQQISGTSAQEPLAPAKTRETTTVPSPPTVPSAAASSAPQPEESLEQRPEQNHTDRSVKDFHQLLQDGFPDALRLLNETFPEWPKRLRSFMEDTRNPLLEQEVLNDVEDAMDRIMVDDDRAGEWICQRPKLKPLPDQDMAAAYRRACDALKPKVQAHVDMCLTDLKDEIRAMRPDLIRDERERIRTEIINEYRAATSVDLRQGSPITTHEAFLTQLGGVFQRAGGAAPGPAVLKLFHAAVVTCRGIWIPDVRWAVSYAQALGYPQTCRIIPCDPTWLSASDAWNHTEQFWLQAIVSSNRPCFMVFQNINRSLFTCWAQPWLNVLSGLSAELIVGGKSFPWPKNLRLFVTVAQDEPKLDLPDRWTFDFATIGAPAEWNTTPMPMDDGYVQVETWDQWVGTAMDPGSDNRAEIETLHLAGLLEEWGGFEEPWERAQKVRGSRRT